MVNQFGLEWVVDGHAYIPDLTSLARHKGQFVRHDPSDLMPIVVPQNLSPRMSEFLNELDRCTSRIQMVFDTMPHLRPHQAHRDGYSVDMFSDPHALVFCLDVAHLHETILAHEVAHVWIDLVEDCEDYRLMRGLTDTTKVRQVLYIQSFVLDRKVNRVIARKGFDLGIIASQQWDTINRSLGSEMRLYDAQTGRLKRVWQRAKPNSEVMDVQFSPDGKVITTGDRNGRLILRNVRSNAIYRMIFTGKQSINQIAFSSDGRRLASEADGKIQIWSCQTGALSQTLTMQQSSYNSVVFSPEILAGVDAENFRGRVNLWRIN